MSKLLSFQKAAAAALVLIGALIMFSWVMGYENLLSIIPNAGTMKFNTALSFAGLGLLLHLFPSQQKAANIPRLFLIFLVGSISLLSLIEYVNPFDLSIDNLFFQDTISLENPGRMSPATALCFLFSAGGYYLIRQSSTSKIRIAQYLLLVVLVIASLSVISYLLSTPVEGRAFFLQTMAIHTSILFIISSLALSLQRTDVGYIQILFKEELGARVFRLFLPMVVFIPLVLGLMETLSVSTGWLSLQFAQAIYAVVLIVLGLAYTYWMSSYLNETDERRREAEQKIQFQNRILEQKNQELDEYTNTVSHDLRQPLRTINSFAKIVLENNKDRLDEDSQRQLNHVRNAALRLSDLIDELLRHSTLGRKNNFREVNLNKVLRVTLEDLNTQIEETGAQIHVKDLPVVIGMESELGLLFQNLITNAIKYVKDGEQPVIQIQFTEKEKAWEFSVRDYGIGMNPDHTDRIFKMFQRIDNDNGQGLGIGLAHCKKIVELHQGEIWVESSPGEGSAFFFTIPYSFHLLAV